jgi:hypothetical protein
LHVNNEESFDEDVQFYVEPFAKAVSPFISAIISQEGLSAIMLLFLSISIEYRNSCSKF